jgi:hypothetical protein
VLSHAEAEAHYRGELLKRTLRAAAALRGLYNDEELTAAAEVQRGAARGWWRGARMKPETIRAVADATGLSFDELMAFVHLDGPLPTLPEASQPDPALLPVLEGIRRDLERQADEVPDGLFPQPERRPRGSGAERG